MIRHTQQIIGDPARGDGHNVEGRPGDCWKTCIASLLELPMDEVPHFVEFGDLWWDVTQTFIKSYAGEDKELRWWEDINEVPDGHEYLIGTGASPRGDFQHAVIVDRSKQVVHDPHPSRAGLAGDPDTFFSIVTVAA